MRHSTADTKKKTVAKKKKTGSGSKTSNISKKSTKEVYLPVTTTTNVADTSSQHPGEIVMPQPDISTPDNIVVTEINNINIEEYINSKKFLDDHKIKISTITMNCTLCTLINIDMFAKYIVLKENEIVSIKFGDRKNPATNRTIVAIKKKQSKRNFFNQVTILMAPTNSKGTYINIKVFNNGSLHFTGCKDVNDFINVTNTLINILKRGVDVKDSAGKIKHINYVDAKKIGIFNIKIRMINSNFKLAYKIDRKKLAFLLRKYHGTRTTDTEIGYVEFKHKPNGGHSCVNIKYAYDENSRPSIFVFQTGAIIITGAKNLYQIISAYHYIHLILNKYLDQIKIVELNPTLVNAEIESFCRQREKTNINLRLEETKTENKNKITIKSDADIDSEIRSDTPFGSPRKKTTSKLKSKSKPIAKSKPIIEKTAPVKKHIKIIRLE